MKSDCQQCGSCCSGALIVEAYYVDAIREPMLLTAGYGKTPLWTLDELEADEDGRCIILAANDPCRFLKGCRCSIYPTRPTSCVYFPAGSEQCEMARRRIADPEPEPEIPDAAGQMTLFEKAKA